jgi:serine protease Do
MSNKFWLWLFVLSLSAPLYAASNLADKDGRGKQAESVVSTAQLPKPSFNISQGFADIVEPLMPCVVNISTVEKAKKHYHKRGSPLSEDVPIEDFNQLLERIFPPGMVPPGMFDEDSLGGTNRKMVSLGSGFIVDSTGHIVTTSHVIADADEINVRMHNGISTRAKIVGIDKDTDLALLKITTNKSLPFAKFGDSDKARVGDWVIAVGNPFGLGNTVTVGVVSANGRDISSEGMVDNYLQTDAAINRGNSGGPMLNTAGEVIGVNTQILSPSGVNIGIGFATPSSIIEPVIANLKSGKKTATGFLGVTMQHLTEDIAESISMNNNRGALVIEVGKNTPAEKAGIEVGDVIVSFNGSPIKSIRELQRVVKNSPIGKNLEAVVIRRGTEKSLTIKLEELPKGLNVLDKLNQKFKSFSNSLRSSDILGASLAVLDDDLRNKFRINSTVNGLVLVEIKDGSVWSYRDFRPGDVLCAVGSVQLKSVDQLAKLIKEAETGGKKFLPLLVQKKHGRMFTPLPLKD